MGLRSSLLVLSTLAVVLARQAGAAGYCLALRGNGEAEPAHWGAIASVVEKLGLPEKQAGGSSAAVTLFFLDAIASNRLIRESAQPARAERAALLLKSLEGFLDRILSSEEWRDFAMLYTRIEGIRNAEWAEHLATLLGKVASSSPGEMVAEFRRASDLIQRNLDTGVRLGLVSRTNYAPLLSALSRLKSSPVPDREWRVALADAAFYAGELKQAVAALGAFNAHTDSNLFFRPGIIDFDLLAESFGRVADFYAMESAGFREKVLWERFLIACGRKSAGKGWRQIVAERPECARYFNEVLTEHLARPQRSQFVERPIGASITSFPATAVITGASHRFAVEQARLYRTRRDPNFGEAFRLPDPEDLKFAYWGPPAQLDGIGKRLDRSDEKSRRFMKLGEASWKVALSLSPAEPGLSPLKSFSERGVELSSAGGWSDLHPVAVLKASGCEDVVYVTRRGGESLFGQGVAKRLLGLDRDWKLLATEGGEAKKLSTRLNNLGDPHDVNSLWSSLYNLANPRSSIKRSLADASAVLCTDWDRFNVFQDLRALIDDSYRAPYYVPRESSLRQRLPKSLDPSVRSPAGYPEFAGCY